MIESRFKKYTFFRICEQMRRSATLQGVYNYTFVNPKFQIDSHRLWL